MLQCLHALLYHRYTYGYAAHNSAYWKMMHSLGRNGISLVASKTNYFHLCLSWLPSIPQYQHHHKAHSSKDNSTDAEEHNKSKGYPRYKTNNSCGWLRYTICTWKH